MLARSGDAVGGGPRYGLVVGHKQVTAEMTQAESVLSTWLTADHRAKRCSTLCIDSNS